ncbi:MAG: hypothetical protein WCH46_01880 [bacterium]
MKIFWTLSVFSVFLQGCPTNGVVTTELPRLAQPKVGSTYSFNYYLFTLDSTGTMKSSGLSRTVVDSVVQTNFSYAGKKNVMQVYETDSLGIATDIYYSYDDSGDKISVYLQDVAPLPFWLELPIHPQGTSVRTDLDSVFGQTHIVQTDTTVNSGCFDTMIDGQTLEAVGLFSNIFTSSTLGSTKSTTHKIVHYSMAPSIGYFTQIQLPVDTSGFGSIKSLIRYVLR